MYVDVISSDQSEVDVDEAADFGFSSDVDEADEIHPDVFRIRPSSDRHQLMHG